MKANIATILGILLCLGAGGCASDRTQMGGADQYGTAEQDRYDSVTGSYLPQDVSKSGRTTNGKDDVRIIDRPEIDQSGGATVGDALRNLGANH